MSLSGHQSAKAITDEWLTPPEILNRLGQFDLDPCAPVDRPWPTATKHLTKADNGLAVSWMGNATAPDCAPDPFPLRVWCNPPFGREAAAWLARMAQHGNGIALVPARTETAMFYDSVWGKSHGVLFIKGRPHFHRVDGSRADFNSGAPICLIAYGAGNLAALINSGLGQVVVGVG